MGEPPPTGLASLHRASGTRSVEAAGCVPPGDAQSQVPEPWAEPTLSLQPGTQAQQVRS